MPCPMVHLAIAVRINELMERSASPDFLLGSIAPDAIHERPNSVSGDKRRVHVSETPDPHHKRVRQLLEHHGAKGSSAMGFAEGYAAHILTDDLWVETVMESFRKSVPPQLSPKEQLSLYYLETDQLDFNLYHRAPWKAEVWSKLAETQPGDFASLLTAEEITGWRDKTLKWFDELFQEPKIVPVHITDAMVQIFIEQAAKAIARTFKAWKVSVR